MADTIEILYDGFVRYEKQKGYVTWQTLAQTKEWEEWIALLIKRMEQKKVKSKKGGRSG